MNMLKFVGSTVLRIVSLIVLASSTILGFWNGFVAYYWENCPYLGVETLCPYVALVVSLLYAFISPTKSHS